MQLILFICFFYNSTCFGRSPRPKHVELQKINQINRISCISLVFYKTSMIFLFHGVCYFVQSIIIYT